MNLYESIKDKLNEEESVDTRLVYLKDWNTGEIYRLLAIPSNLSVNEVQEAIYNIKYETEDERNQNGDDVNVILKHLYEKFPDMYEIDIPNSSDDYLEI
jgi:hypothetical protein